MKLCPLCKSSVVYEGMFSLECLGSQCPNYTKEPPKLPETECEWNKIFAEFGNPWGLFFTWCTSSLDQVYVTNSNSLTSFYCPRRWLNFPEDAYRVFETSWGRRMKTLLLVLLLSGCTAREPCPPLSEECRQFLRECSLHRDLSECEKSADRLRIPACFYRCTP